MKSVYGSVITAFGALALSARAADAPALRYQSKGLDRAMYRLVEVIDDTGGGSSATTAYVRFVATPGNAETDLNYVASMSTQPMATGGQVPGSDPNPNFFDPKSSGNRVTIDRFGKIKSHSSHQDTNLPGGLGQNWEYALPELSPKGEANWHTTKPMSLWMRSRFGMIMGQNQATNVTLTNDYSLGTVDNDAQSIDVSTDISSTGQGNMTEHVTGKGSLVFDRSRGLMQSLNEKFAASITIGGQEHKASITLDMQLLTPEQVDKLKADAAEASAKMAEFLKNNPPGNRGKRVGGVEAHPKHPEWADQIDLPAGTKHTDYLGDSDGGGPFVKAGDGTKPLIGLKLKMGSWDNHKMLGNVEPLFEKPNDAPAGGDPNNKETVILAKDGYVVGGLWMNGPDYADALRVIFIKKTSTGLDLKDQYVSPWFGSPIGEDRIKLGCTGQLVVGVYGRQGLNTNALGLVMIDDGNSNGKDPTDDPNYQGTKPAPPATPKDPAK